MASSRHHLVAGLLALVVVGCGGSLPAPSPTAPAFTEPPPTASLSATPTAEPTLAPTPRATPAPTRPPATPAPTPSGPVLTEADGVLPARVTPFDEEYPGVANLDPDLLEALQQAATDARSDGIPFLINSGWRSPDYQEQLLRDAVAEYGSLEEAAKWVATPETSPHVSGDAADVGRSRAQAWLSENGADYGLCQIYRNEPWHYELRPRAIDDGCPRMYANPTRDPRMQP